MYYIKKRYILMTYGKIDYLNLLPFNTYLKRYQNGFKKEKSGVPSYINNLFTQRRVDYAFISSILAKNYKKSSIGIVAKKEVLSVLSIKGERKEDKASKSSNALANILGVQGKVIIGDKAYKYYLEEKNKNNFIDLAKEWQRKTYLPFVFAVFSYKHQRKKILNIKKYFKKQKVPFYILKRYSLKTKISIEDINFYLKHIDYNIDIKAKKGLGLFLSKTRKIKQDKF